MKNLQKDYVMGYPFRRKEEQHSSLTSKMDEFLAPLNNSNSSKQLAPPLPSEFPASLENIYNQIGKRYADLLDYKFLTDADSAFLYAKMQSRTYMNIEKRQIVKQFDTGILLSLKGSPVGFVGVNDSVANVLEYTVEPVYGILFLQYTKEIKPGTVVKSAVLNVNEDGTEITL